MSLEQARQGKMPDVEQQQLRDSYNMMALPGTILMHAETDPSSRRARVYLYKAVANVAKGQSSMETDRQMVKALLMASHTRNQDHDSLIRTIDRAGLKLRLDTCNDL